MTTQHNRNSFAEAFTKLFAMSFLTFFLSLNFASSQDVTILSEGFEGGTQPTGWSQNYVSGITDWVFNVSGGYIGNPDAAHTGSYNARCYSSSATTELITPVLDFGVNDNNAKLVFWHTQPDWVGDQDNLIVKYRTSETGSWVELVTYTASIDTWTQRTIDLPNVNSTYQICFEAVCAYGFGVCLDDIMITGQPPLPDAGITSVVSPQSPFSVGTQSVIVSLNNFSELDLTSCTIQWMVNGVMQEPVSWSGDLAEDESEDVILGTYSFTYPADGPYDPFRVEFWTERPNGGTDGDASNDRLSTEVSPILNDAGVVGIFGPPEGFTPGLTPVRVRVQNYAPKPLESVSVNWSVDGVDQTPFSISGLNVASGETVDLVVGDYNFQLKTPLEAYMIVASTSTPNGVMDEDETNDEYTGAMGPSLVPGTYYIGGNNPHFDNVVIATSYLGGSGIIGDGDVVFEIRPGEYDGQVTMEEFPMGENNIIFRSSTGNKSDVTISFASTIAKSYVWSFDGNENITFLNLTFESTAPMANMAGGIIRGMNCDNFVFEGCSFIGVQNIVGENPDYNLFGLDFCTDFVFDNCGFFYGSSQLGGTGNFVIEPNEGEDFASIVMSICSDFDITDCSFRYFGGAGINMGGSRNLSVVNNIIRTTQDLEAPYGFFGGASELINNSVSGINCPARWGGFGIANLTGNENVISGNAINNCYNVIGIAAGEGRSDVIDNQIDISNPENSDMAGIVVEGDGQGFVPFTILNNDVFVENGDGIVIEDARAKVTNNYIGVDNLPESAYAAFGAENATGYLANNMVAGLGSTGLELINSSFGAYYNSFAIYCDGVLPTLMIDGGDCDIRRNMFINTGMGYTFDIMNIEGLNIDENNYYTNGAVLGIFDRTEIANIETLKAAFAGNENSVSVMPVFKDMAELLLEQYDPALYVLSPMNEMPNYVDNNMFEMYDWQGEARGPYYYFGVDNVYPEVFMVDQPEPIVDCQGVPDHMVTAVAEASFGSVPLYQWERDGEAIEGENSAIIFFDDLDFDMSATYRCKVMADGSDHFIYSDEILVYVLDTPEILRHPDSKSAAEGTSLFFEVRAHVYHEGEPVERYGYQWYRGTTPLVDDGRIAGAQSSILSISEITAADYADDYYVMVEGRCGEVQSDNFSISAGPMINISQQPVDFEDCENGTAVFTADVQSDNTTSIAYQWKKDGTDLADNARISGSASKTLTITGTMPSDDGIYIMTATAQPGDLMATTDDAMLTVKALPVVTGVSDDLTVESSRSFTIEVEAQGYEPMTYQWMLNGADIAGATAAEYTVASATVTDGGAYTCKVTNDCGEMTSPEINVTINMGGILGVNDPVAGGFSLLANTPNPVAGETEISFVAPFASEVKIVVTDNYGKEVAVLFNGMASLGENKVSLNADEYNLSSGVYYYTMTVQGQTITRKMVVVK